MKSQWEIDDDGSRVGRRGKYPLVRCVRGKTDLPWVRVDRSSFEGGCGIRLDESGIPALERAAERPPPPCARVHGGTSGGSIRGRRCGGSSGSSFFSPLLYCCWRGLVDSCRCFFISVASSSWHDDEKTFRGHINNLINLNNYCGVRYTLK